MKRRIFIKFITLLGFISFLSIFTLTTNTVFADVLGGENQVIQTDMQSNKISIDLKMEVGEKVVREISLPNGEKGKIEITKISAPIERGSGFKAIWWYSERARNGTYFVNAYVGLGYAGFNVDIKSNNITRAYDGQYGFAGVTATGSLHREGNKQATYYFDFSAPTAWLTAASWNGFVRARIEGNQLVTYIQ